VRSGKRELLNASYCSNNSGMASTIDVDGKTVRYVYIGGNSAGPGAPIVLLHGIGRSLDDWTDAQAALAAAGYAVHAIDMAGFGGSDPVADPDLPALARHVLATLDRLGVTGPVHLIGNSLGGAVAMRVAVEAPGRVASLVLVNSAGFGRQVTIALRALGVPGLGRLLLSRPSPKRSRMVVRSLFFDATYVTDERVADAYALASRPGGADTFARVARNLGTWRGVRPGWRRDLLTAVAAQRVPTLIIWGTHDLVLPPHHIVAAARAFPHARTHLFAETGHMPQIERTEAFTGLVTTFLATDVPTGARA
jgi:pimeloyl-ACP methyl ester carboxylesterase